MKKIHGAPFAGAEPVTNHTKQDDLNTTVPAAGFSTAVQAVSKYTY
jgi:hypothetical protein